MNDSTKPRLTRHAAERMGQRNISENEIKAVLAEFHTRYHDKKGTVAD